MEGQGNRPGLEEIRNRIQALRHEIENLRNADKQQRLSRYDSAEHQQITTTGDTISSFSKKYLATHL